MGTQVSVGIEGCNAFAQLDNHRYVRNVRTGGWLSGLNGGVPEYEGTFRMNCGDRSGQTEYRSGEDYEIYPGSMIAIQGLNAAICRDCPRFNRDEANFQTSDGAPTGAS